MPELPEVEVCRRGVEPELLGVRIAAVAIRAPKLRIEIPPVLGELLPGCEIVAVRRRGKYLLFDCRRPGLAGTLIIHLGMSGNLRFVPHGTPVGKHDHFDLVLPGQILRLADPRRFGVVTWQPGAPEEAEANPLLASQGVEPLAEAFTVDWLYDAVSRRSAPIKPVLMDSHLVVGIGNIYASESLFRAGIDPRTPAGKVSRKRLEKLVPVIKTTLAAAIEAGGSSLRDFIHSDGSSGYFQQQYFVYGRTGEDCRVCGSTIRELRQAQRATFYCPKCQK